MKRITSAVVIATLTLLFGIAAPAHAAAPKPSTPMQERVDALLALNPGGVQIGWNEISWELGAIILTLAPDSSDVVVPLAAVGGCPDGRFCAYSAASYGGSRISFSTCTSNHSPSALGGPVRSIANSRSSGIVRAYSGTALLASAPAGSGTNVAGSTTKLTCS